MILSLLHLVCLISLLLGIRNLSEANPSKPNELEKYCSGKNTLAFSSNSKVIVNQPRACATAYKHSINYGLSSDERSSVDVKEIQESMHVKFLSEVRIVGPDVRISSQAIECAFPNGESCLITPGGFLGHVDDDHAWITEHIPALAEKILTRFENDSELITNQPMACAIAYKSTEYFVGSSNDRRDSLNIKEVEKSMKVQFYNEYHIEGPGEPGRYQVIECGFPNGESCLIVPGGFLAIFIVGRGWIVEHIQALENSRLWYKFIG